MIRGKNFNTAESILRSESKRGVVFARKLLKSAIDNATQIVRDRNLDIDLNTLFISEARVDPGPMMKRWRTAPMGRGVPIKKRFSHMILVLENRETPKPASAAQAPAEASQAPVAPTTTAPAMEKTDAPKAKAAPKHEKHAPTKKAEEKHKGKPRKEK